MLDYQQMDNRICGDLSKYSISIPNSFSVEKNKKLDEFYLSQNPEGQIQVRIEQLAVCKILVNIHRKDLFILVKPYTQLGEAYLNNKYYEQALDHLTTALKLNGSLFQKHEQTKQYHSQILTLLGKCYMEAGNFKDALSLLEKSLKMNIEVLGGDHMSNAQIFTVVANVYSKQKEFDKALQQLSKVEQIYLQHSHDPMQQQEQLGNTYLEIAKIHSKNKENGLDQAILHQSKAVEAFLGLEKYADTDYLAQILMNLSEFQDKANMIEDALSSLRMVEKIYNNNYTDIHAKTCKVKRNISLLYLKSDQNDQALKELRQVEELERTLFGESSTQLGKTYKVIGTIHLLNKNHLDAREYLLKAQNIFEQKGLLKLLKEVKQKLKITNPNMLNQMMSEGMSAAQMLNINMGGANDSDNELNDLSTPEQLMGKKPTKIVKKTKKKTSTLGGQQKKVNNYMDK